jgi:hypothetical protein
MQLNAVGVKRATSNLLQDPYPFKILIPADLATFQGVGSSARHQCSEIADDDHLQLLRQAARSGDS